MVEWVPQRNPPESGKPTTSDDILSHIFMQLCEMHPLLTSQPAYPYEGLMTTNAAVQTNLTKISSAAKPLGPPETPCFVMRL